jgi:hypothetical protein
MVLRPSLLTLGPLAAGGYSPMTGRILRDFLATRRRRRDFCAKRTLTSSLKNSLSVTFMQLLQRTKLDLSDERSLRFLRPDLA